VAVRDFLLGLSIGLILLIWQRFRLNARLRQMLQKLQSESGTFTTSASFPLASQLSFAITQQRRDQQQLQQELETLRQVLHNAPVGYLQVDDENRLLWCNVQACKILDMTPEQVFKPRLLLELVRSYELDELIEQTRNAGQICQSNWIFYPTSADPTNLSQRPSVMLQGYGLPLLDHQIGIFLENRQEIATLIQQRDRWTSDLAHELKTPLTSIRLVAETLQTRLDPNLRIWVDRLINETVRLSTLVQDLLDLSQMQRGPLRNLQLHPTDLVKLIDAVWHSLEPLARRKGLSLDYRGPTQLVMQLDEARIHRLLINLLDNSIKYSPANHPIRVQLSVKESVQEPMREPMQESVKAASNLNLELDSDLVSCICLEVIDFGPGFPEAALPQVFERFYRADPSRARVVALEELAANQEWTGASLLSVTSQAIQHQPIDNYTQGGSGLGLAIVRQIVEAHHGSVSADNHAETGGAWLQVCLPWQPEDA
jgi:two-component system, OmpR family, phosphate regulon sensor histidine kinase PhoR